MKIANVLALGLIVLALPPTVNAGPEDCSLDNSDCLWQAVPLDNVVGTACSPVVETSPVCVVVETASIRQQGNCEPFTINGFYHANCPYQVYGAARGGGLLATSTRTNTGGLCSVITGSCLADAETSLGYADAKPSFNVVGTTCPTAIPTTGPSIIGCLSDTKWAS
jgi:hypothetical protein